MTATIVEPETEETTTTRGDYWLGRAMVYRDEVKKLQRAIARLKRRADRQKTLEIENAALRIKLRRYMKRSKQDTARQQLYEAYERAE